MGISTPAVRMAVADIAANDGRWLPVLRAAVACAERVGEPFAGAWVRQEMAATPGMPTSIPNLKRLVTLGILKPEGEATRGGSRRYYVFIDRPAVVDALRELDERPYRRSPLSFLAVGDGPVDLAENAEHYLADNLPEQ